MGTKLYNYIELSTEVQRKTLMFRDNALFNQLEVSISSEDGTYKQNLRKKNSNDQWTKTEMPVKIRGGKAVLKIKAKGKATAQCLIDDIQLVKI